MKIWAATLSLLAALVLQWSFSSWRIGGIPFPLVPLVLFFWYWRLSMPSRLWLGSAVGFLMDAFSIFPPGSLVLTFALEAILAEFLQKVFYTTQSPAIKLISMPLMFFFYYIFLSGTVFILEGPHFLNYIASWYFWGGILAWIIFLGGAASAFSYLKIIHSRKR